MTISRRKFIQNTSVATASITVLNSGALAAVINGVKVIGPGDLRKNFLNPPDNVKSCSYWWWFNGLVDNEGITRDLEEFKAKGICEVLLINSANGSHDAPIPEGAPFLSKEWKAYYRHAMKEAKRLDIGVGINLCSGWDMGGPWIKPENSGRWYLQSELSVTGPRRFSEKLPLPGNKAGYNHVFNPPNYKDYLDLPLDELDYRDTAVVAIPDDGSGHNRISGGRAYVLDAKTNHRDVSNQSKAIDVMGPDRFEWYNAATDKPIPVEQVIDLTGKFKDGHLDWQVPAGKWKIIRTGHRMTGAKVMLAQTQGQGLSVDWFEHSAVDLQFENLGKIFIEEAAKVGCKPLYFHDDSFEDGYPNWTGRMLDYFKYYRGYDAKPYLPVLYGYLVGSAEVSDRFLNDYRKTLGDCMADEHFKHFADMCHKYGMQVQNESAGPSRSASISMDGLKNLGRSDYPMGEFWLGIDPEDENTLTDDQPYGISRLDLGQNKVTKMAASASHLYGRKTTSAEAFTSYRQWLDYPGSIKQSLDRAFCEGINRIAIHTTTATRPKDGLPGYEYGAGTHFNPNVTWWEKSKAFFDYVGRCQYMLRAGKFVADVLFYNGDWVPNLVEQKHTDAALGTGYDYDTCNEEILLTRLYVKNGRIVLPDGMSYHLLVLPDSNRMPVKVLAKINELVKAGATVLGHKPLQDSGLKDYPHCDTTIKTLGKQLWGSVDGKQIKQNRYGNGRIIYGNTVRQVLLRDGVQPDFEYTGGEDDWLDFIHRTTPEAEIYFVINRYGKALRSNCTFRVKNRVPEIWDAINGQTKTNVNYQAVNGRVEIPMKFEAFQSFFIIFPRNSSAGQSKAADNFPELTTAKELTGSWQVEFDTKWGGPRSVEFAALQDWSTNSDDRIKYYSGKAVYTKSFDFDQIINNQSVYIDLGKVKNIADVTLNGKHIGIVWTSPWRIDISPAIKKGTNILKVEVINLWPNRLIGDAALPPEKKLTHTNIVYKPDQPLLPSGLLGPVLIKIG